MKKQINLKYNTSAKQFAKMYTKYTTEFARRQTILAKKKAYTKETAYSLNEFKAQYTALKNTNASKNLRGDITKQLVESQVYPWSRAQAKAFKEGLLKKGVSEKELPSVEALRVSGKEYVDKYIEKLVKEHPDWSSTLIRQNVSETIYGSP